MISELELLRRDRVLSDVDVQFARLIYRLDDSDDSNVPLAACLASRYTGDGHVCLDLARVAGGTLFPGTGSSLSTPPLDAWRKALRASPVVGVPGDYRPLILDEADRLYLHRYWNYEKELAAELIERDGLVDDVDIESLRCALERLFPLREGAATDWQKVAAATAALRKLCVVSGGPGTGKTTTVTSILALLIELAADPLPNIVLAAPTGKAAARLQGAIAHSKQALDLTPQHADAIPAEALTLHRLLGIAPGGRRLRNDRDNPLPVDVLVVDETSMVDLALFTRTLNALPRSARLVLLGDRDQLASVQAGSVLGDICRDAVTFSPEFRQILENVTAQTLPEGQADRTTSKSQIQDSVVLLQESHRFTADSGIGKLAASVNRGDTDISLKNLVGPVQFLDASEPRDLREQLTEPLVAGFSPYLKEVKAGAPPAEVFAAFDQFRVLCAHRQGPYGVEALNALTEALLYRAGYIDSSDAWYPGRPVMITRNDHRAKLFNGDIGLALQSAGGDRGVRVYFPGALGDENGIPPARLPAHETVYALSIHKAQGSEFNDVVVVLPDSLSPVVSRELLYTGITRAREHLIICGGKGVFEQGVARRIARSSGLVERLKTPQ